MRQADAADALRTNLFLHPFPILSPRSGSDGHSEALHTLAERCQPLRGTRHGTPMKSAFPRRRSAHRCNGTTVVETALVLPVFLLVVLALIELGHAQMVKHVLRGACRQAARIGSTEGNSTADVRQLALNMLASCVDSDSVDIYIKDASPFDAGGAPPETGEELEALSDVELADAEPRQLFLVRATIRYENIAIVPNIPYLGSFLDEVVLEGQAFMRHE